MPLASERKSWSLTSTGSRFPATPWLRKLPISSFWGEMPFPRHPRWAANQRVEARPRHDREGAEGYGVTALCAESHHVPESLESAHEALGFTFWVATTLEVVCPEVLEVLPGAEEMPDHIAETVGHRHCRLVGAATTGQLAVLGREVAAHGTGSCVRGLDERSAQPFVAVGGAHPPPFSCRLVIARAQPSP